MQEGWGTGGAGAGTGGGAKTLAGTVTYTSPNRITIITHNARVAIPENRTLLQGRSSSDFDPMLIRRTA